MKYLLIFLLFSVNSFAQNHGPELIKMLPDQIFVPQGFDFNDNAQVVFEGALPSTCYKAGALQVAVDHNAKRILIRNQVYFTSSSWCIQVQTTYTQVANIGSLSAGDYEVRFENEKGEMKPLSQLSIKVAMNTGPDDYLYAPIQEIDVDAVAESSNKKLVTLKGVFTNNCMKLADVKTVYRTKNVVEILPLATMEEKGIDCKDVTTPFRKTVEVQGNYSGRVLYHVRSLNGQAVNQVVDYGYL